MVSGEEPLPSAGRPANQTFLVQSSGGAVLEGALVRLHRAPWGNPQAQTRTDRDGRCELAALPGDEVHCEAGEHLPERFTLPARPWPDPYIVVLTQGSRPLEGTVEDDAGAPIAGAQIELQHGGRTVRGTSEADGGFRLSLPEGAEGGEDGLLRASHPDYFSFGEQDLPLPADFELRRLRLVLPRWAHVVVSVTDLEATPIAAARLQLVGPPDDDERELLPPGFIGVFATTALPELELRVPPGIPLWLVAAHPDFEPREVEVGVLNPGGRTELPVRLARKAVSSRRFYQVVDPEGRPLVDAKVRLVGEGFTSLLALDQRAVFQVVPRGETDRLVVIAPGHGMHELAGGGGGPSRDEPERIVLAPAPPTLVVTVGDGDGGRFAGVPVSVENAHSRVSSTARTDGQGRAAFDVLLDGREYVVSVGRGRPGMYSVPGGLELVPDPPAHRISRASAEPVRFDLVPPGSIDGALELPGSSARSLSLTCLGARRSREEHMLFTLGASLDPAGRFHFTGLPPGRYRLWIHDPADPASGFDRPVAELDLEPGQELRLGNLRPPH